MIIVEVNDEAEYVDIQNVSKTPVELANWRLYSEEGTQGCVLNGVIEPNEKLRIWARFQDADKEGFNCGYDTDIWDDSEPDPAVLYDPSGVEVSRMD